LVHCVHPQIAGLAFRLGLALFPNGHLHGPRFGVVHPALAIPPALAQVVNVRHRNPRQTLVVAVLVDLPFAFQDLPGRWSTQRLVRFIHLRQQFDVGTREAARKLMAA
jgi:hypothetical protein